MIDTKPNYRYNIDTNNLENGSMCKKHSMIDTKPNYRYNIDTNNLKMNLCVKSTV